MKKMCIAKNVVSTVYESLPLNYFISQLKQDKPKELFSSMYSNKIPVYVITEYLNDGVMLYSNSQAPEDRAPEKKTFKRLQRNLEIQGIESWYYNN